MKKFIIKISYTVFPVWLFFTIITVYCAECVEPHISGDLGRLSKRAFGMEYQNRMQDTNSNEILFKTIPTVSGADTSTYDVLTMGDSFSAMGKQGFQHYMCQYSGLKLYHLQDSPASSFVRAYYLLDQGLIDSSKVKHLVVEVVERNFLPKMLWFKTEYSEFCNSPLASMERNSSSPLPADSPKESKKQIAVHAGDVPENEMSVLKAKNWLSLRLGLSKSVYGCKLDRPLFSHDTYDKSLFFYVDDFKFPRINKADEEVVKNTLDKLFNKAKAQGINLIILIAADKYDVYQPFIVDNQYMPKTINEDLAQLYPSPNIIISKFILQPRVFEGEKDVYLVNDSHWSYKASQLVAREVLERIKDTENGFVQSSPPACSQTVE